MPGGSPTYRRASRCGVRADTPRREAACSTFTTPFIVIPGAREAAAFYRDVFGARVVDVTEMGGVVAHAVLDFGHGLLQLAEPAPGYHLVPQPPGEDDCYSLGLYCGDADAVVARVAAAGATVREPLITFVSGDRFASTATRSACAGGS